MQFRLALPPGVLMQFPVFSQSTVRLAPMAWKDQASGAKAFDEAHFIASAECTVWPESRMTSPVGAGDQRRHLAK